MRDGVTMMDMPADFWPDRVIVKGTMKHPGGQELGLQFVVSLEEVENPELLRIRFATFREAFWGAFNADITDLK